MMIQNLFSFISVIAACSGAVVQADLSKEQVQSLLRAYGAMKELHVDFEQQKHMVGIDVPLKSSGKLDVIRPHRTVWTVLKPSNIQVEINDSTIKITYGLGEAAKTRTLEKAKSIGKSAEQSLASMVAWLSLDADKLFKSYRFVEVGKLEYECFPLELSSMFSKMKFKMSDKGHLKFLELSEVSKDTLQFNFGDPKIILEKH